jgi:hypothetical protein
MTFLVLVAAFVGLSCLVVPLLLLAIFAFVGGDAETPEARIAQSREWRMPADDGSGRRA